MTTNKRSNGSIFCPDTGRDMRACQQAKVAMATTAQQPAKRRQPTNYKPQPALRLPR